MKRLAFVAAGALLVSMIAGSVSSEQNEEWPRSVLITNDDGIDTEGLQALVRAFAPVTKTYVIAPMGNRSSSTNYGASFSGSTLTLEPRALGEEVVAYAIDAFPADAVALALNGLLDERPDLVISGVNTGPNLAGDWSLSGTIGAVRIAAFFGVPGIAVSGYTDDQPETLAATARWIVELSRTAVVRELPPGGYLAVSIPRVPLSELTGVDVVRRGPSTLGFTYERADDEGKAANGRERWNLRIERLPVEPPDGTDLHGHAANRITVVPMRLDEHDYALLERLSGSPEALPGWPPPTSAR